MGYLCDAAEGRLAMPAKALELSKYLHISQAAKLCGLPPRVLRRRADLGEVETVYRNGERVFPRAATEAYAARIGAAAIAEEQVDAVVFGMLKEGASDEKIVTTLKIPLDRVLRLRAHRDGPKPGLAAIEDAEAERASARAIDRRREALRETLEKERAERRRRWTG
jgi:hypothetical protein